MRRGTTTLITAWLILTGGSARAAELLWDQWHGSNTAVDSMEYAAGTSWEAADDFDVVGSIERVYASGKGCWQCAPAQVAGVRVRFHEWTPAGPGAQQHEAYVPFGAADLLIDPGHPGLVDVTLPQPFPATGRHFLSLQVVFATDGIWSWWSANQPDYQLHPLFHRTGGGPWGPYFKSGGTKLYADLSFKLYGSTGAPPDLGNDPCGIWKDVPAPEPPGANYAPWHDVLVLAPDLAYAVGEVTVPNAIGGTDQLTSAMRWDGSAWSLIPVPAPEPYPGGASCGLKAIDGLAPNDLWAAGHQRIQSPIGGWLGYQMLVLHWDGQSWTVMNTPFTPQGSTGAFIEDVEVIAPDDVWFVGFHADVSGGIGQKKALAMHWDGTDFTLFDTPFFDNDYLGGHSFLAVEAVAPDDVWAVGGGFGPNFVPWSQIARFDGTQWTQVDVPMPGRNRLRDVAASTPTDVWMTGTYKEGTQEVPFFMHWDGSSFTQVANPGSEYSLVAVGPNQLYAGGEKLSHWNGSEWIVVDELADLQDRRVYGLDAAGDCTTVMAVGWQNGFAHNLARRLVPSPWNLYGSSIPGTNGPPELLVQGTLEPGTPVVLSLTNAPPGGVAMLLFGSQVLNVPFLGGTLVPVPTVQLVVPLDAHGEFHAWTDWKGGFRSGLLLVMQAWVPDPGAPFGYAASHGVVGILP